MSKSFAHPVLAVVGTLVTWGWLMMANPAHEPPVSSPDVVSQASR